MIPKGKPRIFIENIPLFSDAPQAILGYFFKHD
jgi:hypothetical protein